MIIFLIKFVHLISRNTEIQALFGIIFLIKFVHLTIIDLDEI